MSFIWNLVRPGRHGYSFLQKCLFSPTLCPGKWLLLSPAFPRFVFWRYSILCFLVDEPMESLSNPIQINFLVGVSIPKLFLFLFCEPSLLIVLCLWPSTQSFFFSCATVDSRDSICFGIHQSDSVFSWNIYHLKILQNHGYISLCCIQYTIIFLTLYTVIFISSFLLRPLNTHNQIPRGIC